MSEEFNIIDSTPSTEPKVTEPVRAQGCFPTTIPNYDPSVDPSLNIIPPPPNATVKVDGVTEVSTKDCKDCGKNFPRHAHYFTINKAGSCSSLCHECVYQKKVKAGKPPRFPAKNGMDQKEYYDQLIASTPTKPGEKPIKNPAVPKSKVAEKDTWNPSPNSPWMKPETVAKLATLPKESATKIVTEFKLDPVVTGGSNGEMILTINDYFKMGKTQRIRVPESASGQFKPTPIRLENVPPEMAQPSEIVEDIPGEYPDPDDEEDEDDWKDPRQELHKDIVAFPQAAKKLELTHEVVNTMSDEECESMRATINAISVMYSDQQLLHYGVYCVTKVVETSTLGVRVNDRMVVDLTGWSDDVAGDENVGNLLMQSVRENEEILEEISPTYKLLALIFGKGILHNNRNNERRRLIQQKNGYSSVYGTASSVGQNGE